MAPPDGDVSANPPIRLTRTRPEPDSNLARGHASLQRGETELSRQEFEQALQRDPNNTDALLALAAIAHRQGRPADAEGLRQRALVANPSDPATQAAVLNNLSANADPHTAESRLKSLLSSQPESAPLNFALGNLYSRQSRWAEAQQVYFNAVAADGDNPDYLFNLAVSLDHLRQPRLAAQHYQLALEAAAKRPAGFVRENVQKRLGELQAERQP
jgi:Tfp pilus assembly protein PilF